MKYTDAHDGFVFTAKTSELKSHLALSGNNDEIERDFHIYEIDGNALHDALQFAEFFFVARNEIFTTYEEIWLHAKDLDEFEKILCLRLKSAIRDKDRILIDLRAIQKFVEIALNNEQDLIFYT